MSDTELIERLAAIPYTGAVSDILDEMGWHDQSLPAAIQSLVPGQTLAGRALTLRGQATESEDPDVIFVPFLKMLGEIQPGDVLVYETNDDTAAHLGELIWRIGVPVIAAVLALLAVPLAFVNPRLGRSANLIVAVLLFVRRVYLLRWVPLWARPFRWRRAAS